MTTMTEQLMQCMEAVRDTGLCNMFDRRCVEQVVEAVCDDDAVAEFDDSERRGYGTILAAFSKWKQKAA